MTKVLERLGEAPFEVIGQFTDASNATLLAHLLDRSDRGLAPASDMARATIDDLDPLDLAVYKPRRGEVPLWDFPDGTLHRREVAAYRVSDALGWDLVPETVLREDGPFGPGALQRYVPHDPAIHHFHLRDADDHAVIVQLQRMVLFDLMVNNADRKAGHVLLEDMPTGPRVRCIDHGVTFHAEPKLRTVAWDWAHDPVPPGLRDDLTRLGAWVDSSGSGDDGLGGLLAPEEIDALAARIDDVANLDDFPPPLGPRPFPWPLV